MERARSLAARVDELDLVAISRPVFVLAQGATILLTWGLWQSRTSPPVLPVVDGLPQLDMSVILLATLALVLFRPAAGVIAHAVALLVAFAMDQTRLQPEIVSLAFLLWGTTQIAYARTVAMAHLVSLWFWAGLNKALSLDFMNGAALFLFDSFPWLPGPLRPYFGWVIIATEISIGVLLLIPRVRRAGVVLAVGLHVLGLVALVNVRWNEAVWPWNVALAVGAVAFFWPRDTAVVTRTSLPVFAVFLVLPAAFYGGYLDAYLGHNLYTGNIANATVCGPTNPCTAPWNDTWAAFNAPLPPEPRLYRAYFDEVCVPGEQLTVYPRRTRVLFGRDTELAARECPTAPT
ncbi:MAG TPA: MauE/DoxX family redox-associated membrane protein [Actinomycetota bacterium]|jgi:hypothetical protein